MHDILMHIVMYCNYNIPWILIPQQAGMDHIPMPLIADYMASRAIARQSDDSR